MIDYQSLRIGNLIQSNLEKPRIEEVTGIWRCGLTRTPGIQCDSNATFAPELLFPIPLTSELLEKIGFTKTENKMRAEYLLPLNLAFVGLCLVPGKGWHVTARYYKTQTVMGRYIHSLHSLQNWYFAINDDSQELDVSALLNPTPESVIIDDYHEHKLSR